MPVYLSALATAYEDKDVGTTFGGMGDDSACFEGRMQAHIDLKEPAGDASADSTWCERNVYGTIFTYARAVLEHCVLTLISKGVGTF